MNSNLLRFGLLSLLLVFACIAKAQDVTAIWDFQKNLPEGINTATNFQGTTGDVNSTVDGITMHVDATTGKLKGRTSDAQFNTGTKLQIPVKSAKDVVTVTSYPNYHNYTVGGVAATADVTDHKATSAEVAQGYVEVIAIGSSYLYQVKVVHVSAIQEKALYSTNFTNWTAYDRKKTTNEVVNLKTLYSKENFTITLNGVGVSPTDGKFAGHTGFMQTAKYTGEYSTAEPSAVTSVLANITKITLHQAATGSKRGIKVSVKGDGDTDWVAIHNQSIVTTKGEDLSLDVNRTNCQIKFENFALAQNAYVTDLAIYGKVDMSKTPMLGSFSLNGEKYQAVDIFNEDATGKQLATLLISKKATLISESNPLTDITADNGTIKSTTYTTKGEGNDQKTVVTIVVEANGDEATYELTVAFKPDFTLTYYNIDGTTVIGTQTVEQDAIIGSFKQEAEEKVTVADGKKFRGWAPSQEQDEKKYTTSSAFTSDAKLYAVVTDIETANTTARYDFNLQKEGFCADDHEAFCVEGNGKWHDTTHGWSFSAGDKIKILMGGKGYIKLTLCSFSTTGDITLTDPKGNMIASVDDAKASKDGFSAILQNNSTESGAYTLTFAATAYLHGLSIVNMTEPAYAKNGNWYTVKAGDTNSFLTTLEVVNAANAAADAARSYIFLPNGTYDLGDKCLTQISGNNISIIGESMDNTIIVNKPAIENEGIGTTATLLNLSNNLYLQDLTLKDALDYYKTGSAGRAVCLQDRGTQTICKNVKMLSYQDTYYSNEPNGKGQFYFEDSEIHGTVDYVCGGGDVYFNRVLFVNESRKEGEKNGEDVIAAPNSKSEWGYIFKDCTIENKAKAFSLGRSWNNITRLTWLNTTVNQKDEILNDDTKYAYFTINAMGDAIADKFRLDVLKDAEGNVFSPAEKKVVFKNSGATQQKEEENIILTAEEAATYSLDAVFGDWKPEVKSAQAAAPAATLKDGTLSWTGEAKMYLVSKDGKFYALTSENSLAVEGEGSFTVRAANEMGGFGRADNSTDTGIENIATSSDVLSTKIYSADGVQVSKLQRGINIVVKTMTDGSKKTNKVVLK